MNKFLAISLVLFLVFFSFAGCSGENNVIDEQPNEMLRVTFINPLIDNPYWDLIQYGIEDAAKEYGIDVKVSGSRNWDDEARIKAMETAIAAKVDAIIAVAFDSELFVSTVNKAIEQGILVILVDTDEPESDRTMYIGTENWEAGYRAGEYLTERSKGSAKIGIITGTMKQNNLNKRINGFKEALAGAGAMEVISVEACESDLLKIEEKTMNMLVEYPEMNAIFCAEGYGAVGVGKVIEELDPQRDIFVIGFDDVPQTIAYVREGVVDATFIQEPYKMGYQSIKVLLDIQEGYSIKDINTQVKLMNRSNMKDYEETN